MKIDFSNKELYVDWVSEVTAALYDPSIRYIFLKGGAGAGKSYLVAQLIIQNILD
jgi:chromosomal replication initiation ATPase DnaA